MFPCFWRENSAWEHVLFVYLMFQMYLLLAMIANWAVQLSIPTLIHDAILFIDTSTMFDTMNFIL